MRHHPLSHKEERELSAVESSLKIIPGKGDSVMVMDLSLVNELLAVGYERVASSSRAEQRLVKQWRMAIFDYLRLLAKAKSLTRSCLGDFMRALPKEDQEIIWSFLRKETVKELVDFETTELDDFMENGKDEVFVLMAIIKAKKLYQQAS